jgi:hypothetical protein
MAAACIAFSSILSCRTFPKEGTTLLIGALFTILITAFFASVADVWYAVGSGQFQMVSLDTAGMMVYFILPATLLYLRFLERYGKRVGEVVKGMVGKLVLEMFNLQMDGVGKEDSLLIILSLTTAFGVPLMNAFCPMGGYLFARAYTHGQPNTKKVALCVKYSDLGDTATLVKSLEENKAVLNILVSDADLRLNAAELTDLAKKGHCIALAPVESSGFNLLHGFIPNNTSFENSFDAYKRTMGESASWMIPQSLWSRYPAILRRAHDFGMKVAYWSTLVEVGSKLSEEQRDYIVSDVNGKNGGNIIYITSAGGYRKESVPSAVLAIVNALEGYSIESLSQVIKDDKTMAL